MKTVSTALMALGLLMGSNVCAMADTIWNLNDVVFDNGNQATGFFITDPAVDAIESFSVMVTGPSSNGAFTAALMVDAYLPNTIGIANSDFSKYVDLYLASPLTSAGGNILITSGFDCPGCGTLLINSNHTPSVFGMVATPEPSSVPFLTGGVILMAWMLRRKLSST